KRRLALPHDLQLHPGVPAARQRLPVRGYAQGGEWHSLRLLVDGEVIAQTENAAAVESWWQLSPGPHRFWLEGERLTDGATERSEPVLVVVE
ncbi:MAG TPA: hypothetical protein PL105_27650, partial [Caldilineaceae bacterium]|nr:hypothetical protein [Caldilineaceae bacterium]